MRFRRRREETWEQEAARVGRDLAHLGRRSFDMGDMHEYRHAVAALKAGNSADCDGGANCHLDRLASLRTTTEKYCAPMVDKVAPHVSPARAEYLEGVTAGRAAAEVEFAQREAAIRAEYDEALRHVMSAANCVERYKFDSSKAYIGDPFCPVCPPTRHASSSAALSDRNPADER